ncbi:NYN domain-containing protein [uncultured Nocardioides sp.]|uniref:NYN domain-containing protein n=1 Tax=uncultured Nocardioides sp. TaxID=198441 RepID=UPI0026197829|nr:NYN domain-containing protein [uncultured Nocardioides sp.]
MSTASEELPGRVAVYVDFENLVISLYDATHGEGAWRKDDARKRATPAIVDKLESARLDLDAIIDYAASMGVVTICRAYCDWTVPAFAAYGRALTRRSVDLVQMFPMSGSKNGADIRLAVDALEDLERFPYLTHLLVAAGDSDYVPLAQKARRLDRRVIGVGVAGSVGRYWELACDEFRQYDALVTLDDDEDDDVEDTGTAAEPEVGTEAEQAASESAEPAKPEVTKRRRGAKKAVAEEPPTEDTPAQGSARGRRADDPARTARKLLLRALKLGHEQRTDDWVPLSMVKTLMLRLAPDFSERAIGFSTFSDFVQSHREIVMYDTERNAARLASMGKPGRD